MSNIIVSPSILSADFANLEKKLKIMELTGFILMLWTGILYPILQ